MVKIGRKMANGRLLFQALCMFMYGTPTFINELLCLVAQVHLSFTDATVNECLIQH